MEDGTARNLGMVTKDNNSGVLNCLKHFSGEKLNVLESIQKPDVPNRENLPAIRNIEHDGKNLLVPKPPWSIVLHRKGDGITVLHNPDKRIVSVKQFPNFLVPYKNPRNDGTTPDGFELVSRSDKCSMCGRPWPDEMSDSRMRNNWMNNEYFSYLKNLRDDEKDEELIINDSYEGQKPSSNVIYQSTSNLSEWISGSVHDSESDVQKTPLVENMESSTSNDTYYQNSTVGYLQNCINQGYYKKFFIQLDNLGNGQGPDVYLCNHILDNVSLGYFAIKTIPIGRSHKWLARVLKEVFMLSSMNHENIIRYYHAWIESTKPSKFVPEVPCLFILMEYANGGNLQDYIDIIPKETDYFEDLLPNLTDKQRKKLGVEKLKAMFMSKTVDEPTSYETEREIRNKYRNIWLNNASNPNGGIMKGIDGRKVRFIPTSRIWLMFIEACTGLNYLHKHNILHRDMKPSNILLQFENIMNKDFSCPKVIISDFGNCRTVEDDNLEVHTGNTGTIVFLPPELIFLEQGESTLKKHSIKSDIWSLGLVLYFMCYTTVPYIQKKDYIALKKEIKSIKKFDIPECQPRITPELRALLNTMLDVDQNNRPTTVDILTGFDRMHANSINCKSFNY